MINQKIYRVIPEPSAGVFDVPGSWTVLQPLGTTRSNLARNPSAELSATAQWFIGGTFPAACTAATRSTAEQKFGAASFKQSLIAPDYPDVQCGFYFTPQATGKHFASIYVKTVGNINRFQINVDGITDPENILFRPYDHTSAVSTDWFRWVYAFNVNDLTPKLVRFRGEAYVSGDSFDLYLDGAMVERGSTFTDYFDGSFPNAYWSGAFNASESVLDSTSTALADLGFQATAVVGANAPIWNTISTPFAFGGGYYQRSTPAITDFSIIGTIEAGVLGRPELEKKRRLLAKVLSPRGQIPLQLLYHPVLCNNETYSKSVVIDAVYTGGLEGNLTNEFQETVSINLRVHTPYIARDRARSLMDISTTKTVNNKTGILKRDTSGNWTAMPTDLGDHYALMPISLRCWAFSPDGRLYVARRNNANDIQLMWYDEPNGGVIVLGQFAATSSSPEACDVQKIGWDNAGRLWVSGQFNTINGNACNNFAVYTSGAWSSPITTITEGYALGVPRVSDFCFLPDGQCYIVGNFATINGNAMKNIARYVSGSGFFALVGPGINGAFGDTGLPYLHLTYDGGGRLYVYGRFTGVGSNFSKNLWYVPIVPNSLFGLQPVLDVGMTDGEQIYKLIILRDGRALFVGDFTQIGDGVNVGTYAPCLYYAYYDGRWFTSIPQLVPYGPVQTINQSPDGNIHLGIQSTDGFNAGWIIFNGTSLVRPDYLPGLDSYAPSGSGNFFGADFDHGNTFLFGIPVATPAFSPSPAKVPNITTVVNAGDSDSWPEIYLRGPMDLRSITNYTTGKMISFNTSLTTGETATLKLYPQLSFVSSTRGDIRNAIQVGSNVREFFLAPGNNLIGAGINLFSVTANRVVFSWFNAYDSIGAAFTP